MKNNLPTRALSILIGFICANAVAVPQSFDSPAVPTQVAPDAPLVPLSSPLTSAPFIGTNAVAQVRISESYGKLPLSFEANQGQSGKEVKFLSRGQGYSLFLTLNEAVLSLRKPLDGPRSHATGQAVQDMQTLDEAKVQKSETAVVRMRLVGANPKPDIVGLELLPGKSNYFLGKDTKCWHTDVSQYAKVKYYEVYPGIDMVYYGHQRQLEYDFVVAPGSDPKSIRLSYPGISKPTLDTQGNLILHTPQGDLSQHKPLIYQEIKGKKYHVDGRYVLRDQHQVGFQIASYDPSQPLIIDPVLSYSTYLGGGGRDERSLAIAVDGVGNAYITGATGFSNTTAFPTTPGAFDTSLAAGGDVFVAKLNAAGNALIYSTYLGGNYNDKGQGIAVDAAGNAYVTGQTFSPDFPTQQPLQASFGGGIDVFITKLNATGNALVYSTYLGDSKDDVGFGIAVDSAGKAYVTGINGSNAFVRKLNTEGNTLAYSLSLGGSRFAVGRGIAVDNGGNAYVTGTTLSPDFPTTSGAFDRTCGSDGGCNGFNGDIFVTRLDTNISDAASVRYSTYLGGSSVDEGSAIAVDSTGKVYVTGATHSSDFPTLTPLQATYGGGLTDAFVAKLNTTLSGAASLRYSTYLGGSGLDEGNAIAVDGVGEAYVTGITRSADFPTTFGALDRSCGSDGTCDGGFAYRSDAFVSKLNGSGKSLFYSTFLGGGGFDVGNGITLDSSGNAYVTGETNSPNFPTKNAFQALNGGSSDAFISKIVHSRLRFSAASYSANEGAGLATIIVERIGSKVGAISVTYATSNGTATAAADYTAKRGTLSFADGNDTPKTFSVPINDDAAAESNETVKLTLSNPTGGATLAVPSSAVLTIIDND